MCLYECMYVWMVVYLHDHKYLLDSKVVSETLRVRVHPRHREVGGSGGVEGGPLLKIKLKISISESSRNLGGVERGSLLKINNLTRSKFHFQNVLQIWKGTSFFISASRLQKSRS